MQTTCIYFLLNIIGDYLDYTNIQKSINITGKMLIATSCFKIQENWLAVNLMINVLQVLETLIGTVCMPRSANVHPGLT